MTGLVLDCDGVLADTERYGHLPAFNATFAHFGLPVTWTEDEYAEKLRIGGGKERMASLFRDPGFVEEAGIPEGDDARSALLADWHRYKTAAFTRLVAEGALPGRPGIRRVVLAALDAGWTVAVASTSAEPSVRAVLEHAVGSEAAARIPVFAGDVVPAKKPDPAIYQLALRELGREASDAVVVEDSGIGLQAARAADIRTVVTISGTSRDDDFTGAALVVTTLGDPDGEAARVVDDPHGVSPGPAVDLAALNRILSIGESS
jgi:HAD superfamily hydrolase (TIGR01509 family)